MSSTRGKASCSRTADLYEELYRFLCAFIWLQFAGFVVVILYCFVFLSGCCFVLISWF